MHDDNQISYFRPLGAHERLLFHYSVDHPRHFCIAAYLKAERCGDDYLVAFNAVRERHPLLRAGICLSADGSPVFFACDDAADPILVSREQYWHWTDVVEHELEVDFDAAGPLHRAAVLWHPTGAFVILTFHHAIADGMAGIAIVEDLMRSLAGEALEPLAVPQAVEIHGVCQADLATSDCPASVRMLPSEQDLIDVAGQPLWRDFKNDRVSVSSGSLDGALAERLHQIARQESTTINSVICVALALAARDVEKRDDYTIMRQLICGRL
ncbi:condensation domain-containing protein [Rhizobium aegyptiacum]|uniref:condensation domain-containing protein n=1 Tax=Rhizobium aegyptiacum TaxID=1764550 RepID=UPI0007E577AE|nr:condensation domain-containing protein [Rhizobium aegyptiacum]